MNKILVIIVLITIGFFSIAGGLHYLDKHNHHILVIGAGTEGGESYAMAKAISKLAEKYDPLLDIVVAETGGSGQNNRMLHRNLLQLATIQADTKAGADTRLITMLYPDAFQVLVRENSGINSISDLKGKAIALPGKSSGQYKSFFFLAEHYGLTASDINVVSMSSRASAWALEQGAIDGIFKVRAPGNVGIQNLIAKGGVKLLPIPHSEALRLERPSIRSGEIPAGSYQGYPAVPSKNLPTPTVQRLLVSTKAVDKDLIERVTRLIYENRRELTDHSPLAGFLANPVDISTSSLPVHPGALAYFERDKPSFLQENVEVFAFYLTVLAGLVSLLFQMNNRKMKGRVDAYNRELIGVYNTAIMDETPTKAHYRNIMMDIFARVLQDSEQGTISATGFEFLSFAWDELNDAIIEVVAEKTNEQRIRR